MKKIFKIAKTELQMLFYSPIAWLILVLFLFQCAIAFNKVYGGFVMNKELGRYMIALTSQIFSGWQGLFTVIQDKLYLYIPLLTMGLMSREYQSGSIKLLYSSPVTNVQIILGKYLSMMIYSLALIGILMIFVIFGAITIENFDWPAVLVALLGLYLLMCTYAAIGLFMSSITSYQIIAAVLTLAILSGLNLIRTVGQDLAFVRDLTYWLSINGRVKTFVDGMICSEDLLYFLFVSAMFVALSIVRLSCHRQKTPAGKAAIKYIAVVCCAFLLGFASSRPQLMGYIDATRTHDNTISKGSQEIMSQLKGRVEIHSYSNLFDRHWNYGIPRDIKNDQSRFKHFVRFKPDIKLKYHYYYDTLTTDPQWNAQMRARYDTLSDPEIAEQMSHAYNVKLDPYLTGEQQKQVLDLSDEGNRFVRQIIFHNAETKQVQKTWLRIFDDMYVFPFETEIAAAFKRLTKHLPSVGFVAGQGERDAIRLGDREYNRFAQDKPFRSSLINQGFNFAVVSLDKPVPDTVNTLVIAEPKFDFTEQQNANLDEYIARGGNLYIAGEPRRAAVMNKLVERFGVKFFEGTLVHSSEQFAPDLTLTKATQSSSDLAYKFLELYKRKYTVTMPTCSGIDTTGIDTTKFHLTTILRTDGKYWNEVVTKDFVDDSVTFNPEMGEVCDTFATAIALSRKVGEKEQKIIISGDADCISNGEISQSRKGIYASNYRFIEGSLNWESDGEVPVDTRGEKYTDNDLSVSVNLEKFLKIFFAVLLPLALAVFATFLCLRRKGR